MKQFCKKVILRIILLTVKIASNSHNSFSQFISKHFGEIKKCESNSEKNSISFASTVLTELSCKSGIYQESGPKGPDF